MKRTSSKRLGDLINLKRGYDLPESERIAGDYPVISSSGISGYHNDYKVEGDGVVIGRYGTLGEAHFVQGRYWPHNTSLYITDFKGNSPRYIYYLLACIGRIRASDKSAVPGVNRNELHEMAVPAIEDRTRQNDVAKVLSTLDAKIELNNLICTKLEKIVQFLYEYWFIQFEFPITAALAAKMRDSDLEGKPYRSSGGKMVYNEQLKRDIPDGWEAVALSELANVANESIDPSQSPNSEFNLYSIPIYDKTGTYSVERGAEVGSDKFLVTEKDLLVSKLNPWFSRVVFTEDDMDAVCSTEFVVWKTSDSEIKSYLFAVATSTHFRDFCTQNATGTSNSHKRVNPEVMMSYRVPYEQEVANRFGQLTNPLLCARLSNQKQNQQLKESRDWLLPMLMNGQVIVE